MYVQGMYIQLIQDMKTVSKDFNIQMGDIYNLAPFEFEVMSMMIEQDVSKEQERLGN